MTAQRICERCHKVWEIEGLECPEDGGKLLTISSPDALIGRVIDGKLTLTGVLGQGGMGVVYRARQHSMDREVAVKVLHPSFASDAEAVRRFLQEGRAATRLDHPNIITVFDFGRTDDGLLYIVMELLVGHPLAAEVDAAPIAPARAVHILTQVADAVEHAHGRGLIHRDLKPENVFLIQGSSLRGDHIKVLDFGIASMRSQEGLEKITRTGAVCGTPAYMSPEQVLGDKVDARSDVYSLAVVAFEMLTGQHPFRRETPMRQMLAHLEHPVPSFRDLGADPSIPPGLEQAVRRALEKKRDQRTQTALEFAHELVAASGKVPTAPAMAAVTTPGSASSDRKTPVTDRRALDETGRATPAPRAKPRWPRFVPYAAVLGVILAAVSLLALRQPDDGAGAETKPLASAESPLPAPLKPEPAKPEPAKPEPIKAEAPKPAAITPAPTPTPTPAPTPTPVAPAPFTIDSIPTGADVVIGGKVVAQTPFALPRPEGDAIVKLVLKRTGFRDFKLELGAKSQPPEISKLQRLPKKTDDGSFKRID